MILDCVEWGLVGADGGRIAERSDDALFLLIGEVGREPGALLKPRGEKVFGMTPSSRILPWCRGQAS